MIYELKKLSEVTVNPDLPLFCDTETCGLYGSVRLLQLNQADWDKVILVDTPNKIELMAFLMKHHTVWHNAHYDLTTIHQQLGTVMIPEKFDDTFLLSRIAQPHAESFSLDSVMARSLNFECPYMKAGLIKEQLQKSDWSKPELTKDQLLYAAIDVKYMPEVWEDVKSARDTQSYQLDISTLRSCLDFQWSGMPVDSDKINSEYTRINKELAAIPMPVNANSWQQVRKWLNVDKSDKQFLSDLALRGNEKARAVLDVRTRTKLLSFLKKYDTDRLVGKFKPSARSGRLTSDDENLQQIPRALKGVFGYPEDSDRILIYSDLCSARITYNLCDTTS